MGGYQMNATHAYICINPKGEVRGACVDDDLKAETAKTIARWVKQGYTIERVLIQEARDRLYQPPKAKAENR